ncbi:putative dna lyase protein [Eutypa lata UCREL1]|uniref:Putative dna lyase protein n=1 Tax=Eutypa lata (strain UCR-EL1) TaxID=1287681 RepID=M7TZJ2_EUTLA|nr:putative dna lyase protein [Eutypa lata UCREL1]
MSSQQTAEDSKDMTIPNAEEKFIDPIQSKESWQKLMSKRVPPKCEHGEECTSFVTKKAGANKGRSFYTCARPLGPSGDKERGTEWRCPTFMWSSDWNG